MQRISEELLLKSLLSISDAVQGTLNVVQNKLGACGSHL
jgi:hypothetical protein